MNEVMNVIGDNWLLFMFLVKAIPFAILVLIIASILQDGKILGLSVIVVICGFIFL